MNILPRREYNRVESDGMIYRIVEVFGVEVLKVNTGVRFTLPTRGYWEEKLKSGADSDKIEE